MARNKKPDAGTVFGDNTWYIRGTIHRLHTRAIKFVPNTLTYQDMWDMMYPTEHQHTLKFYLPKVVNRVAEIKTEDNLQREIKLIMHHHTIDEVPRPQFITPNFWDGPRKYEVLQAITDISGQLQVVDAQWQDVKRTFELLNQTCKTLNKMFSLWPAIKQLVERSEVPYLVNTMGEYKPYPVPNLTRQEFDALRGSIPVVGIAMIAFDGPEPEYDPAVHVTYIGEKI